MVAGKADGTQAAATPAKQAINLQIGNESIGYVDLIIS
jgi:hypothetical protein